MQGNVCEPTERLVSLLKIPKRDKHCILTQLKHFNNSFNEENAQTTKRNEIEECLKRGADCMVLVEMEFLELQPLLHVLVDRGDVTNVQCCLEHTTAPLDFANADASGSTVFHVLSRSRSASESAVRAILQALIWRLQTHPADTMCWVQLDMDRLDVLSSAARFHRLTLFWEALSEMPYFADHTAPLVIRTPVFLWDWKSLEELVQQTGKEAGLPQRSVSSTSSFTSSSSTKWMTALHTMFTLQKGILSANEALSRVCHWQLYYGGAVSSLSASITELVDAEEARIVRHCVMEEGADVLFTPRARVLPCLHQLILDGAVACVKACLETPRNLRVNYTEWDDPRCKPFYRPGILGTRLVDCFCHTVASDATAVEMLSALLDRFERHRHTSEEMFRATSRTVPLHGGAEGWEGNAAAPPSRRDRRPSVVCRVGPKAADHTLRSEEEQQVVWYTVVHVSSQPQRQQTDDYPLSPRGGGDMRVPAADSHVTMSKTTSSRMELEEGRGAEEKEEKEDIRIRRGQMSGGRGRGIKHRCPPPATTSQRRRRAHPDFLSTAAEDGRLSLFWPLVKPFVCRQLLWCPEESGQETVTALSSEDPSCDAAVVADHPDGHHGKEEDGNEDEWVVRPLGCTPPFHLDLSPPPWMRLHLIRGVSQQDWDRLEEEERERWFVVEGHDDETD